MKTIILSRRGRLTISVWVARSDLPRFRALKQSIQEERHPIVGNNGKYRKKHSVVDIMGFGKLLFRLESHVFAKGEDQAKS